MPDIIAVSTAIAQTAGVLPPVHASGILGITVPDAIAIGMMILAALAAWRGTVGATEAKKNATPSPADTSMAIIGAAIVDRTTLAELTDAVRDHAAALREQMDAREQKMQDKIDRLLVALETSESDARRRR
jgi:hypothetical protein